MRLRGCAGPGGADPAGTECPPPKPLAGLVVTPAFGKGVAYLRDLRIDDTDFMFTPYCASSISATGSDRWERVRRNCR